MLIQLSPPPGKWLLEGSSIDKELLKLEYLNKLSMGSQYLHRNIKNDPSMKIEDNIKERI